MVPNVRSLSHLVTEELSNYSFRLKQPERQTVICKLSGNRLKDPI